MQHMKTLPLTIKIDKAIHDAIKKGPIGKRVERLLATADITLVVAALNHRYDKATYGAMSDSYNGATKAAVEKSAVVTKVLVSLQALENFNLVTARTRLSRDFLLNLLLEWDITTLDVET